MLSAKRKIDVPKCDRLLEREMEDWFGVESLGDTKKPQSEDWGLQANM